MGGQNHQPCNSYLDLSTKISRTLSQARSNLEYANIAFEDVILAELCGGEKSVAQVIEELGKSGGKISETKTLITALRKQMDEKGFQDLPPLKKLDLVSIGQAMAGVGMINEKAWEIILEIEKKSGFYGVLDFFNKDLDLLLQRTNGLKLRFIMLNQPESEGRIAEIMEKNLPGNVKIEFAQLYTAWLNFQARFLASSMISTEIWYAFTKAPSLVAKEAILKAG